MYDKRQEQVERGEKRERGKERGRGEREKNPRFFENRNSKCLSKCQSKVTGKIPSEKSLQQSEYKFNFSVASTYFTIQQYIIFLKIHFPNAINFIFPLMLNVV